MADIRIALAAAEDNEAVEALSGEYGELLWQIALGRL